jgi:hypothetical protein
MGLVAVTGAVVVTAAFAATVGPAGALVGTAVTLPAGGIGEGALVAGPPGNPGRFPLHAASKAATNTKATIKVALGIQVYFIVVLSFFFRFVFGTRLGMSLFRV